MMKILFVFAHPDDEAFGPAGTISRLVKEGNDVTLMVMCNGARPGSEHVAVPRQHAFAQSSQMLGVRSILAGNPDMSLEYNATCKCISELVALLKPEHVYTHNISDINADHRLVAEACLIACRPKPESSVNKLFACEGTSSTDWTFSQIEPTFKPNTYVNVEDYIDVKRAILELYSTETYAYPDDRSIESALIRTQYRGSQVGFAHAEAFQLIMERQK